MSNTSTVPDTGDAGREATRPLGSDRSARSVGVWAAVAAAGLVVGALAAATFAANDAGGRDDPAPSTETTTGNGFLSGSHHVPL